MIEIVLVRMTEEDGSLGVREADQIVLNLWLLAGRVKALIVDKISTNAFEILDGLEAHKAAVITASRAANDLVASSIPGLSKAIATMEVVGIVTWEIVKRNCCGRACPACVTSDAEKDRAILGFVHHFND